MLYIYYIILYIYCILYILYIIYLYFKVLESRFTDIVIKIQKDMQDIDKQAKIKNKQFNKQ